MEHNKTINNCQDKAKKIKSEVTELIEILLRDLINNTISLRRLLPVLSSRAIKVLPMYLIFCSK
ncbi:hypothetical protein KKF61_05670 [Patescibacteria group bacterium]|nr:hypothetical protein [Patescibacteria group bacterium]